MPVDSTSCNASTTGIRQGNVEEAVDEVKRLISRVFQVKLAHQRQVSQQGQRRGPSRPSAAAAKARHREDEEREDDVDGTVEGPTPDGRPMLQPRAPAWENQKGIEEDVDEEHQDESNHDTIARTFWKEMQQ